MPHPLQDLVLIDHTFECPLDPLAKTAPDSAQHTLEIYAREVRDCDPESVNKPWLVYFQGGPGYGALRPTSLSGWLAVATGRYRVLLLDQRGTGRSTPVDATSLATLGDAAAQARYLSHFRADAIVADAEAIRSQLSPGEPWTILGQSFGGFCALNYLSSHPQGLAGVMITGGIPPVGVTIDDVYRATYARVLSRNRRYHQRYPQDADRLHRIAQYLRDHEVRLPGGSLLTAPVLQLLGLSFGFSDGFEPVHYLLEQAFINGPDGPELSFAFLHGVEQALPFDAHPIFSILHEALYTDCGASNWSAQRVRSEFPQFEVRPDQPFYFTGEMIYPWMFDTFARLRPLRAAAELLAARDDWPALYDEAALAANKIPTVAAIYEDDMYVERHFSETVAQKIPNMHTWTSPEWDHNALRADSEGTVFKRLLGMLEAAS